jgi:citrate lyase synthetase
MALQRLSKQEMKEAAGLLAGYWKRRGMPQYTVKWAEKYFIEGHRKEIKKDEFFVWKEKGKLVATAALVTDVSNVVEIRDLVVKKGYGKDCEMRIISELVKLAERRKLRKIYALIFPSEVKTYASQGFVREGMLRNHFRKGEHLVIMSRFL